MLLKQHKSVDHKHPASGNARLQPSGSATIISNKGKYGKQRAKRYRSDKSWKTVKPDESLYLSNQS